MRKAFLTVVATTLFTISCWAQDVVSLPEHINSVTAISKVCGDGRKVETIVIEYDAVISNKSLSATTYRVEDGEILRVYANALPQTASTGMDGKYVVIELNAVTDMNAVPRKAYVETEAMRAERDRMQGGPGLKAGWSTGGNDIYPGNAVLQQLSPIATAHGVKYAPTQLFGSTQEQCAVVDDFVQKEFVSPFTGQILPYNLYLPQDYNPQESYPLVLFIHDAGTVGNTVNQTLVQGLGAVTWATPQSQAQHKCIVVAPQYPVVTVDDNWNYSHHLDATVELLEELQRNYSVDSNRIYTTGQSMGCMSSIVLMLKRPDLFAGALLVAGKWKPELMAPLADQNIWIISCEGDGHSNELQGKAVELWREAGATVAEATWDMEATAEEFEQWVDDMRKQNTHLLFTHFRGGNHRATWYVAYDIEGIRDWLFQQQRSE